jgi:hypothetical protein
MAHTPVIIRKASDPLPIEAVRRIAEMIQTVRFGSITLVVQDGKVAQIDKTEKFRLSKGK